MMNPTADRSPLPLDASGPIVKPLVAGLLVLFAGLNVYALVVSGWGGFLDFVHAANGWTLVAVADLCISLTLVVAWMVRDGRARGRSVLGYVALTIATGSIGPLLYLLRRE